MLVRTPCDSAACEHGWWPHSQGRVGADTLWAALLVSMTDDRIPKAMLVHTPCEHDRCPHPQCHVGPDILFAWPMTASPRTCSCGHLVSMADDRTPNAMLVRTPCEDGGWPHTQGHVGADTLWVWPMAPSPKPCWCGNLVSSAACEHGRWPHPQGHVGANTLWAWLMTASQGHVGADTLWAWPMTAPSLPCWCGHLVRMADDRIIKAMMVRTPCRQRCL